VWTIKQLKRYTHDPEIGNSIEFHGKFKQFNSQWNSIEFYISSEIQAIQLSHDSRPHPHVHSLCDMEFKEFRAKRIL
jgi:hypothetical protein